MNKTIIALLFMLSATLGTTAALATDNQEKGRNMENIELTSAWDKRMSGMFFDFKRYGNLVT